MSELLLELLSEEIPARMQRRAIDDLKQHLDEWLQVHRIRAANITGYVTPRRLTVIANGIPEDLPPQEEDRRGPRIGAPQAAIDGFLRSAGLATIEDCEVRDTGRGEFYFAVIKRPGRAVAEVLPDLIYSTITDVTWPKSMRWPASSVRWIRPLTSIICLFDGEILPLALDGVPVGRATRGHRFLSPDKICVGGAADYVEKLQHAYVIVDQDQRRELIRANLDRRATELGVVVKPDPGLLDEVTGLAEFPVVLAGAIDADFMTLPPEVLQTAMRVHQKYFSSVYADGRPAPHFLFVANNLAEDGGKAIIAGNERVLRARLADARFFWDQDRKIRLEDRVEALKDRVYHANLGTVFDKVERMEKLASFLAQQFYVARACVAPAEAEAQSDRSSPALDSRFCGNDEGELERSVTRAAHLAKADLSTGMVGEFPELQGIMGRYYALNDSEAPAVAAAVAEHYRPLGPDDTCPIAPESVVVALADKLDTLAAFFAVGEKPTGSRDPFALRRAAQGVIRLVLENELRLPLRGCLSRAVRILHEKADFADSRELGDLEVAEEVEPLIDFFFDRLRVHVRDQGVGPDLIKASRTPGRIEAGAPYRGNVHEDDLTRFMGRVRALQEFLGNDDGANLLTAYRRASNIVAIEEKHDNCSYGGPVDRGRLLEREERALERHLREVGADAANALQGENFEQAMTELARLRQPVDAFFEKVTVNIDDAKLRENRLRLLARIRATMNQVADFSLIEG